MQKSKLKVLNFDDSRYPADLALLPNNFFTQEDIDAIDQATDELFHALLNLINADSISKD